MGEFALLISDELNVKAVKMMPTDDPEAASYGVSSG